MRRRSLLKPVIALAMGAAVAAPNALAASPRPGDYTANSSHGQFSLDLTIGPDRRADFNVDLGMPRCDNGLQFDDSTKTDSHDHFFVKGSRLAVSEPYVDSSPDPAPPGATVALHSFRLVVQFTSSRRASVTARDVIVFQDAQGNKYGRCDTGRRRPITLTPAA